jgi:membrane-associated phospholipid phosphatase
MYLLELDKTLTFKLYFVDSLSHFGQQILYSIASLFIYLVPIILIILFFRGAKDRINSIKIFLTAILSWQVLSYFTGYLLYHYYGFRDRPFASKGLSELLFERPQKAFPSDHSAVLFAVMLAFFAYKYPKLGWLFLIGGVLSSFGRVMIGFHYVGDVFGGWILGAIALGIVMLLDKPLTKLITKTLSLLKLHESQ